MARTRGASAHLKDAGGELLDKEGKPIPTERTEAIEAFAAMADAAEAEPPTPEEPHPPRVTVFRCDRTTWQRNMEAYEAMMLLDIVLGGIKTDLSRDEWGRLSADVKRHFREVVVNGDA